MSKKQSSIISSAHKLKQFSLVRHISMPSCDGEAGSIGLGRAFEKDVFILR